jgi:hypothetical protein
LQGQKPEVEGLQSRIQGTTYRGVQGERPREESLESEIQGTAYRDL